MNQSNVNEEISVKLIEDKCIPILNKDKQNHFDRNNIMDNFGVDEKKCYENDIEIVNNAYNEIVRDDADFANNSIENMTKNGLEIDVEIKIENFDAYEDENNKIYKKYNLRKSVKAKSASLNEDTLFEDIEHQIREINYKTKKSKYVDKTIPDQDKYYTCDVCSKTFNSKYFLTSHKEGHDNKNIYTCFYCHKDFEKNTDLIEHKRVHKNERCFSCTRCKKAFSSEILYIKHTYNHLKPPYKCQECLFTAKGMNTIKAHVSLHSNTKKEEKQASKHESFECGECGKTLSSKTSLDYHMISHTGVKREQCLYCGKAFANAGQVKIHTTIHTDERSYECDTCNMKFKQYSDLKRHQAVHSSKRFECDDCGKKFLHKESIKFHKRLHTNYKPYKCPECHMRFPTSTHLTSHTYRAHLSYRFSCDVCNLKFPLKKDITRHIKSISHRNKMFASNIKDSMQ